MSDTTLVVCGLIGIIYNVIWIPMIMYHCLLYYKNKNHQFISAHWPKTTLLFVFSMIGIIILRTIDALIGMKYMVENELYDALSTFLQTYPMTTLLLYKFSRSNDSMYL